MGPCPQCNANRWGTVTGCRRWCIICGAIYEVHEREGYTARWRAEPTVVAPKPKYTLLTPGLTAEDDPTAKRFSFSLIEVE